MSFEFDKDFDIELSDFRMKERGVSYRYWIYEYGGSVCSCQLVDGVVYFGSADHHIYAVDAKTGKEIWRFRTGDLALNPSPEVHGNRVYVVSYDSYLYALDKKTGKES